MRPEALCLILPVLPQLKSHHCCLLGRFSWQCRQVEVWTHLALQQSKSVATFCNLLALLQEKLLTAASRVGWECFQAAYNLTNTDTGLLGDVSDPYVVVRLGGQARFHDWRWQRQRKHSSLL